MKTELLLLVWIAAVPSRVRAAVVDARDAARISDSAFGVDLAGIETGAAASTTTAALLDVYARNGVKWARVRASWAAVETSTGVDETADLDALVAPLFDRGIKVLLALDGAGQKLYADGAPPTGANGALAPWLSWVGRMSARYAGTAAAWQVWDDAKRDWPAAAGTADYSALLRASDSAIRAHVPAAVVVLGGAPGSDLSFLGALLAGDDGRVRAAYVRPEAGLDARARSREIDALQSVLAAAPLPRPALWLGASTTQEAAGEDAPSATIQAKLLAREEIAALSAGAARRFAAPLPVAPGGAPLQEPLTVLRTLAALFDDGVAVSDSVRAAFTNAPRSLVSAAFATRSGVPLIAFWSDDAPTDDDPGRQASLSLSQPVLNPVLVDPLGGETRPLGSGSLTTVSVPVRDYPQFVTAASVLKDAAAVLIVPEETDASPASVRVGEKIAFRFDLTAPASATIDLFTARHELLRTQTVDAAAGPGSWEWTADVGPGAYYWRLTVRGQTLVGRFEVAR